MSEEVKLSKSAKDKEKQAQDEAKLKTLETVLGKIEKTYGKGAVMNMAARPTTTSMSSPLARSTSTTLSA